MQTSDVSYTESNSLYYLKFFQLDQKLVIVLCNLKPAKMRGIMSEASMFKSFPYSSEFYFYSGHVCINTGES
jgi:hypothetical protein